MLITAFEVAFFFTVYNVYVWILMYGYLPSSSVKIFCKYFYFIIIYLYC